MNDYWTQEMVDKLLKAVSEASDHVEPFERSPEIVADVEYKEITPEDKED